jgi:outer membrane lipoprotein-sorting protein
MTKFIRTFFAAAVFAAAFGFASVSDASAQVMTEILNRMDAHNKALTSLRANVTMEKMNSDLGGVVDKTQGRVQYLPQKKGNPYVRIDWVRPEESIAIVNKQYILYRPRLKQAIRGNTDKAQGNAKAGGALAFINMSRAELRQNYNATYIGEATLSNGTKTWHIRLTPKVKANYQWAEAWIDANGMPVQTRILEVNNDTTTVLLTNIEKNVRINASSFEINPPKGTSWVSG